MYPYQSSTEAARIVYERRLTDHASHTVPAGPVPVRRVASPVRMLIGTTLIRFGVLLAGNPRLGQHEPG